MRGSIIGQGDNQVIICRLTAEQAANAPQFAEDFLTHLDREQQRYGVPLKKTECWYSSRVYEANKELYVSGQQLTNGMKHASKIASDSNDATNVFETKIASIATMAETVAKRMMTADAAYFVSTVELLIQTYNASLFGDNLDEYLVVPFWGTALGGLPVAFYNQLVIRGHPDRLTLNLSVAKYLSQYERDIFLLLCKYSPLEFSRTPNPELLLLDAHALDFPRHLSVASYLKAKVRGVIRARSTNPTITKYFSEEASALDDSVVQSILSMRPFAAHLAMELYRCSNAGIVLQFVALFENSLTLVRLTQQTLGASIIEDVRMREQSYFGYLTQLRETTVHIYRLRDLIESSECMTTLAERLRLECWGFEIVGASVAAPMDQTRLLPIDSASDAEIKKSVIIICSDELTRPHNSSSLGVGPFRAYLGSKTVEKTTKSSNTEIPTTVPAQAALRLETLKTWVARVGGPNLKALVQLLIEEKGLDLSQYAPRVERGDIYHRLKTPLDSSGAIINSVLQKYTHVKFATSSMEEHRRDEKQMTIFFQALFLYLGDQVVRVSERGLPSKQLVAVLDCAGCTKEVPSSTIEIMGAPLQSKTSLPPSVVMDPGLTLIATTVSVANLVTGSIRNVELSVVGDPTHMLEEETIGPVTTINMSDFRRTDFRYLPTCIVVRSHYMLYWAQQYEMIQSPVVPQYLLAVADCILRSGRLEEAATTWGFIVSYDSSLRASSLARQLFLAFVLHCKSRPDSAALAVRYHYEEETTFYDQRVKCFEETFGVEIPRDSLICLGPKGDAHLIEQSPVQQYSVNPCLAGRGGLPRDPCLVSPEDRNPDILIGEPIPFPLYHLTRGMGRGSSAASKYAMIINSQLFTRSNFSLVVSLADGCGGVLSLLLHTFPTSVGLYNSLLDKEVDLLQEPGVYVPSALVGCGLEKRIIGLRRSVLESTNILQTKTQKKIVSLSRECSRADSVLLTMDAETTDNQNWISLLGATLTILVGIKVTKKVAIIKLIIPQEAGSDIDSSVESLLSPLGLIHYWSKPVSSNHLNNEIFLIVSNCLEMERGTSMERAKTLCTMFSSCSQVQQLIDLGMKLKDAIPCLDISHQNLVELTLLPVKDISPRALFRRLIKCCQARWEELERDVKMCEYVRRRGREEALTELILPIFILYHYWGAGRHRVLQLTQFLSSHYLVVCDQSQRSHSLPYWPVFTSYTIQLYPSGEGRLSILDQSRKVIKKVMRALLTLYCLPPPHLARCHPAVAWKLRS